MTADELKEKIKGIVEGKTEDPQEKILEEVQRLNNNGYFRIKLLDILFKINGNLEKNGKDKDRE